MQRGARFFLQSLFLLLTYSLLWLSLWVISFILVIMVNKPHFLPQGYGWHYLFYFGDVLVADVISRMGLYYWLTQQQLITHVTLYLSPLISLLVALEVQRIWWRYPLYWQRLTHLSQRSDLIAYYKPSYSVFSHDVHQRNIFNLNNRWYFIGSLCFLLYEYLRELQSRVLIAEITPEPPLRTPY